MFCVRWVLIQWIWTPTRRFFYLLLSKIPPLIFSPPLKCFCHDRSSCCSCSVKFTYTYIGMLVYILTWKLKMISWFRYIFLISPCSVLVLFSATLFFFVGVMNGSFVSKECEISASLYWSFVFIILFDHFISFLLFFSSCLTDNQSV